MYEYTLATLGVMALLLALDKWLLRTHIITLRNTRLWKTTAVFAIFQLVLDNYLTAQGLWIFDPHRVMGIYLPFIPIENILFGVELLWMTLLFYAFARTASR